MREAGVKNIQEIRFAGDLDEAKKKVIELLRADRKPGMVFSPDQIGFSASYNGTSVLGDERPYVVAGYSNDESGSIMARSGEFAAVAIFSPERLIRKAIIDRRSRGRRAAIPRAGRAQDSRSRLTAGSRGTQDATP